MSHATYHIIRRCDTTPRAEYAIDFGGRKYNIPLCGTSNYELPLVVGDIVGVVLQANTRRQVNFKPCCQAVKDIENLITPKKGSYTHIEEHFFRITKVRSPSKFDIEPVFIEGNKVILKSVDESYNTFETVPTSSISKEVLFSECFEEQSRLNVEYPEHEFFTSNPLTAYFSGYKGKCLIEYWESRPNLTPTELQKDEQQIKRLLPFKDYKKTSFPISEEKSLADLKEFYNFLEANNTELIEILGEELVSKLGSYDVSVNRMVDLHKGLFDILPEILNISVTHQCTLPPRLGPPEIKFRKKQLKLVEIFRVYKEDPIMGMGFSTTITNWSGIILPDEAREELEPGNIVRVRIISHGDDDWSNVIYFDIIRKVSQHQFLASIRNMYCSEYEDIILVIDCRAVTEIPVDWEDNNNFAKYRGITQGEGFQITGVSGAIPDQQTAPFNYDNIVFEVKSTD